MRRSSAATKSSIELLASFVWAAIALTAASTFLTRWSSSAFSVRCCSSARLRAVMWNPDADNSVRASFAVGNETARLDPSHFATSSNDAILYAIFALARIERHTAELFDLPYVVWVHGSQAFAACDLDTALREAVEGRVAFRDLHDLCVGVVRVAADATRLSGQRKLNVALSEGQLGLFTFAGVSRDLRCTMTSPVAFLKAIR